MHANGGATVEEGKGHDGQALPRKAFCSSPAKAGRAYVMGVWACGMESWKGEMGSGTGLFKKSCAAAMSGAVGGEQVERGCGVGVVDGV